jgi:hypothetical protein
METPVSPPGEAWHLGTGPFIFSGVPPLGMGDIDLFNDSDLKVRVRTIPVVGYEGAAHLARFGLGELRVATPLRPGQRTRARAFFRLDPSTPPGTYHGALACGAQQEPVTVHVWERRAVRIDRGEIHLRGVAGETLTTVIVVRNEGNVTESFRDLALVFLEERNWVGRAAVFALRDTKADDNHQAYLDRVLGELKESLVRPARINLRSDVVELQPGEIREIGLDVTLPAELIKGRCYFGSTRCMSGKLIFRVECTGGHRAANGRTQ